MDGSGCGSDLSRQKESICVGDDVEVTEMRVLQLNDPSRLYCEAAMFPFRITGTVTSISNTGVQSKGGGYGLAGGTFNGEGERFYLDPVKYEIRDELKCRETLRTRLVALWGEDAEGLLTDQQQQLNVQPEEWSVKQSRVFSIQNIEVLAVRMTTRTGIEEEERDRSARRYGMKNTETTEGNEGRRKRRKGMKDDRTESGCPSWAPAP